jgi:autotransporter passenger strand-loop-strand repeat protein
MTTDTISNGQTISLGTIAGSGTTYASATVSSGGELKTTTVSSGGAVTILAHGVGSGLTVLSGGVMYDAGMLENTTLSAGGETSASLNLLTVAAGGIATGITMSWSGNTDVIAVSSGGLLSSSTLLGGNANIYTGGHASGITASIAGLEVSGGTASGVTLLYRGHEEVYGGGTTTNTVISSGGVATLSGGSATSTTVDSGGQLAVSSGGYSLSATISAGGTEAIIGNGSSGSAVGSASLVLAGGAETLTSGGVEIKGTDSGTVSASAGGTTTSETVASGGVETIGAGGSASATAVAGGGTLSVTTSGTVYGTKVAAGGHETMTGNGSSGSAIGSGSVVASGGTETLAAGGVEIAGTDSGSVIVSSGGVTSAGTVQAGGTETVSAGGVASATVVSGNGAVLDVTTSGLTVSAQVSAGGIEEIVGNGVSGSAIGSASVVSAGGSEVLSAGGIEIGGTVLGEETVGSGGTISNTTIDGPGGMVTLASGAAATGGITFGTAGGTLDIGGTVMPSATLVNFAAGDVINFSGISFVTGATYTTSGGDLIIEDGGNNYTLAVSPSFAPDYQLEDNDGALELVPCFVAGTHILAEHGEVPVEDLRAGDTVITLRDAAVPMREIIWTGRRRLDTARHVDPDMVYPVRIRAGAFAPGVPERDLRVSPLHAIYIDGHLIEARLLINGATVIQERQTRHVTYHHIELDQHDVMLAEGLPAESFLDTGNRNMFEGEACMVLHPDFRPAGDADFCAPLVRGGAIVTAARRNLLERAAALGFTTTDALALRARAGQAEITPVVDGELVRLAVPAGTRQVELQCPAAAPVEISAALRDVRRLGVSISRLALVADGARIEIALDDPGHTGMHEMEADHRWTSGTARIALPEFSGDAVLEVTITGRALRWADTAGRDRLAG